MLGGLLFTQLSLVFAPASYFGLVSLGHGYLPLGGQLNDQVKQNGSTSDMMFKIPALIEHVSSIMSLEVSFFPPAGVVQRTVQLNLDVPLPAPC